MANDQELFALAFEYVNNVLDTWDSYDEALRYLASLHAAISQYMSELESGADDDLPDLQ